MSTSPLPSKTRLAIEFGLLCVALPTIIIVFKLAPHMIGFLWGSALIALFLYIRTPGTKGVPVWRWNQVTWEHMKPILIRWVFSSIGMVILIYLYDPEKAFGFISQRLNVWAAVMFFYPIVSALPQEFIFCTFFFARFAPFFQKPQHMVWASAIVFAYAHVLYINPVAPLLSLVGGYIFASTYAKHKSLALVTIEHALYGNVLFTTGLGYYFYGGAVRSASQAAGAS